MFDKHPKGCDHILRNISAGRLFGGADNEMSECYKHCKAERDEKGHPVYRVLEAGGTYIGTLTESGEPMCRMTQYIQPICFSCGKSSAGQKCDTFLEAAEVAISGMCSECQREIFSLPEEPEEPCENDCIACSDEKCAQRREAQK